MTPKHPETPADGLETKAMTPEQRKIITQTIETHSMTADVMSVESQARKYREVAAALAQALADSDRASELEKRCEWLEAVCEATSTTLGLAKEDGKWRLWGEKYDEEFEKDFDFEVASWTGTVAGGYPHLAALKAAMKGNSDVK